MYKFLCFLLILSSFLKAETYQTADDINKINIATINTLLIFTSQEGLNSGIYHFTNTPLDTDMQIYHLPFTYNFTSNTNINYFIVGNLGYSKVTLAGEVQNDSSSSILKYFNQILTYTFGIGGGLRYSFSDNAFISFGSELIYSRAGVSVRNPDGNLGDIVEDFFNDNYSNNLTYKFFTLAEYRPVVNEFKPYISASYKLYETKSSFALDELVKFDSESSVATVAIGVETPKLFTYNEHNNVTLETYIHGHYLSGVVEDIVKFKTYGSIGGVAYYNTEKNPWWASRFFLELNSVFSDGLSGYNVGVGFTLDF